MLLQCCGRGLFREAGRSRPLAEFLQNLPDRPFPIWINGLRSKSRNPRPQTSVLRKDQGASDPVNQPRILEQTSAKTTDRIQSALKPMHSLPRCDTFDKPKWAAVSIGSWERWVLPIHNDRLVRP